MCVCVGLVGLVELKIHWPEIGQRDSSGRSQAVINPRTDLAECCLAWLLH